MSEQQTATEQINAKILKEKSESAKIELFGIDPVACFQDHRVVVQNLIEMVNWTCNYKDTDAVVRDQVAELLQNAANASKVNFVGLQVQCSSVEGRVRFVPEALLDEATADNPELITMLTISEREGFYHITNCFTKREIDTNVKIPENAESLGALALAGVKDNTAVTHFYLPNQADGDAPVWTDESKVSGYIRELSTGLSKFFPVVSTKAFLESVALYRYEKADESDETQEDQEGKLRRCLPNSNEDQAFIDSVGKLDAEQGNIAVLDYMYLLGANEPPLTEQLIAIEQAVKKIVQSHNYIPSGTTICLENDYVHGTHSFHVFSEFDGDAEKEIYKKLGPHALTPLSVISTDDLECQNWFLVMKSNLVFDLRLKTELNQYQKERVSTKSAETEYIIPDRGFVNEATAMTLCKYFSQRG